VSLIWKMQLNYESGFDFFPLLLFTTLTMLLLCCVESILS